MRLCLVEDKAVTGLDPLSLARPTHELRRAAMRLCLVEDNAVAGLEPLTLTRPVFDLLLGARARSAAKIARAFGSARAGPPRRGDPAVPGRPAGPRDPHIRRQRSRLAGPRPGARGQRPLGPARRVRRRPTTRPPGSGLCDGQPACALVGPDQAVGARARTASTPGSTSMRRRLGGRRARRRVDRPPLGPRRQERRPPGPRLRGRGPARRRATATWPPPPLVGPADRLFVHETARIDPYTVFDTTSGPITVAAGAWVQPFTRVEGPCYIGRDTQLFRANLRGGVTLGPNCRIGGEVEAIDRPRPLQQVPRGVPGPRLRRRVGQPRGDHLQQRPAQRLRRGASCRSGATRWRPGQAKVGCFIGDHTRTGLGSMLNTGTAIGVMCNVLPAGPLLPKHVPSFAAVLYGRVAPGFPLEQMFATARIVMGRRGQVFTRSRSSSTSTSTSRPGWSASGPSKVRRASPW